MTHNAWLFCEAIPVKPVTDGNVVTGLGDMVEGEPPVTTEAIGAKLTASDGKSTDWKVVGAGDPLPPALLCPYIKMPGVFGVGV